MDNQVGLFDKLVGKDRADDMVLIVDLDLIEVDDFIQPSPEFVDSVREHGVIQPVLLRPYGDTTPQRYIVMDGRRRVLSSLQCGFNTIPALIRKNALSVDGYVLSVVGQEHRSENLVSEARAVQRLIEAGATEIEIISRLHLTRERYDKIMSVADLPETMLKAVEENTIAMSTAQKVSKLPKVYREKALQTFEEKGKLTGADVDEVKTAARSQASQAISDVLAPLPKTPVEIVEELLGCYPDDYTDSMIVGWTDALNALIDIFTR